MNPTKPNSFPSSYRVIYDVPFKKMYLNEVDGTIVTVWNERSQDISEEDYRQDARNMMNLIKDTDAHFMITDHRENRFTISPELQKWYADLIAQVLGNSGFEKCAVIVTSDLNLLSALEEIRSNLQQMGNGLKMEYRFFNDMEHAEQWIHSRQQPH